MSEEDKKVENKDTTKEVDKKEEKQEDKKLEYTATQQRAMEQGWRPKAEFDGPEEEFIDAAEFIRRGELFGKIEQQRKDMAELRKTLKVVQEHYGKVKETEFNRALELLKRQKVEALKEGEPERVVEIETQIDSVKDQMAEQKANAQREAIREEPVIDPRFTAWVEKNRWYAQDPELKEFADSVGIAHTKANPGIQPERVLKYVEERVRKVYPDKFSNPNRDKASAVEASGGRQVTSKKSDKADDYELTPEEEKVFNTLKRSDPKFWTREKYVADLKALSGKDR